MTSAVSVLRSSVLVVAACLALATAVHSQTNTTGGLDPSEAAQLRDLAERGHAASAFQLGVTYVQTDPAEAVKWILLAAEQEHAEAQAMLGRLYYIGRGVPQDYSETLRWYRRAIEQDDPRAQFYLGLMYYNGHGVPQDESEAVKWIRRAADQGDAEAQFEMGGTYSAGAGVPQDYAEAARWYTRAADQGYVDAQFLLWLYHHEGRGVPKDPVEAARWLRMAAEQGHADAQFKLGMLYVEGDGVPQDATEAVKWLRRAGQQGHAQTLEMFGDTLDELDATLEDVGGGSETQGDARLNQLIGAAESGDAEAQYGLGLKYGLGEGVEKDYAESTRWYRMAAEQGHAGGQYILGSAYETGSGVERDFNEALRWFRLAAENGDDDAAEHLESLETWRCFDLTDINRTNALLTLSRLENGGEVSVAGTTYSTSFEVGGLNRRWDFGPDDDGNYDYMFRISPDGTGLYYDFSRSTGGTAKASQTYTCELSP